MRLVQGLLAFAGLARSDALLSAVAALAIAGPVITVSAGFWDAVSHLYSAPEYFWSTPHIIIYAGVMMSLAGAVLGCVVLRLKRLAVVVPPHQFLRNGVRMVLAGSLIQVVAGFGDSLSHDVFGIDGLISWTHQPLELGLVIGSLGAVFVIKSGAVHPRFAVLLPVSIVAFLFFCIWLAFNLALIFGHVIQCIPVYEIFSSGCAIL